METKTDKQSDTEDRRQRIKLWTGEMKSLTEQKPHSRLVKVHFLHTKKASQTMSAVMFQHQSLPPVSLVKLNHRVAMDKCFENHTAMMLLSSSALARRLNKALKKIKSLQADMLTYRTYRSSHVSLRLQKMLPDVCGASSCPVGSP